jgi:hypothetical protein
MGTVTATGSSERQDSREAISEALAQATASLRGRRPSVAMVFYGPRHDAPAFREVLERAHPEVKVVGCSSAGEFTERGMSHHGLALMLLCFDDDTCAKLRWARGMKADTAAVAERLCHRFDSLKEREEALGRGQSTTLLFSDGMIWTGEQLLRDVADGTSAFHEIAGGAAGDEAAFQITTVLAGDFCESDSAAALHLFTRRRWGLGVAHGVKPNSRRMKVTRSTDSIIHEIDRRPAYEVYKEYAAEHGEALDEHTLTDYLVHNQLGVYVLNRLAKVRAPMRALSDGSLVCVSAIPKGSRVCIVRGEPDSLVEAAREAAISARDKLAQGPVSGVLVFDCVTRGMILGDDFGREIDAVTSIFPDVPVLGFLTYGEVARSDGKLGGWNNCAVVVVAIPG